MLLFYRLSTLRPTPVVLEGVVARQRTALLSLTSLPQLLALLLTRTYRQGVRVKWAFQWTSGSASSPLLGFAGGLVTLPYCTLVHLPGSHVPCRGLASAYSAANP